MYTYLILASAHAYNVKTTEICNILTKINEKLPHVLSFLYTYYWFLLYNTLKITFFKLITTTIIFYTFVMFLYDKSKVVKLIPEKWLTYKNLQTNLTELKQYVDLRFGINCTLTPRYMLDANYNVGVNMLLANL